MARAFWKGAISFGMVSIPVNMYIATVNATPSFHLLHKKCLTRPKQVLYCEKDDEYFKRQDTVRGYEYARDQFAVLKDSDFDKVPLRTTRTIDIVGFVNSQEIDPIYFYDCHYLEPEDLAAKPFCLLRDALRKTGRLGIAKVSFQRREHLCCLRPKDNLLLLHTMHYQPEIVPEDQINIPEKEVTKSELEMAETLIKTMEKKFDPTEYRDEYRRALEELVKAKLKGVEVKKIEAMPRIEEIPDLMSALKASVEAAAKESATRPRVHAAAARKK
jgi:DNA end-binding protein Ku